MFPVSIIHYSGGFVKGVFSSFPQVVHQDSPSIMFMVEYASETTFSRAAALSAF